MQGSVLVSFDETRDVYIDNTKCGTTNEPFGVEVGSHICDLGTPIDYIPSQRTIKVKATHTPLAPLAVKFERPEEE